MAAGNASSLMHPPRLEHRSHQHNGLTGVKSSASLLTPIKGVDWCKRGGTSVSTRTYERENVPGAAPAAGRHRRPTPGGRVAAPSTRPRELLGGWTWTPDPSEVGLPTPNTDPPSRTGTGNQVIRAFAWSRILIG